jgi:serine/threonine-protein kinase
MAGSPRVFGLLEEMLDSGQTPEEVCRDCLELLPEVSERWREFCRIDAEVGAMLPENPIPTVVGATAIVPHAPGLPRVPGYELEAVLGHGGMGAVYKARHLRLNRVVALKMALAGVYASPDDRKRFQREAEAVAGLRHPNVVQIYDVGDSDGLPYFTMEFVDGGSLAAKLAATPQPARQAAEMMTALAGAMEAAHRGGIVHRDLKPGNVLLTSDGAPKVSDFGLARRLDEAGLTRTGVPVGTPSYMAPEQARGNKDAVGPAADIYALGAILYELLTGRPPFRAETAAETVQQVIYQEPASPSRLNAKVPRDLETICLKCLRKEPERRYASATVLADDLRRFLEGRPIQARPVGWAARLWRWGRRNPAVAAQVLVALALVGLTVGSVLWLERQHAKQREETERQQAEQREETARQEGREAEAVEAVLGQAAVLQKYGRWPEAQALLDRTPAPPSTAAPEGLLHRLRRARADAKMLTELEEIRLHLLEGRQSHEKMAPTGDRLYAEAFGRYGIDLTLLEPAEAAARIRNSAIRETLLAFLHDWLYWVAGAERDKLRTVVERADDDEWRRELREALAGKDERKLQLLLRAREATTQPPVVLAGLSGALFGGTREEEARMLLLAAQQRHPEDFWINFQLGYLFQRKLPQEAAVYFRVAVAIRPESAQAYTALGRVLFATGEPTGAITAFRTAAALNPRSTRILVTRGGLEEARAAWEKVLDGDPPDYNSWYGYAQLCLFLGKEEAYRQARKALLDRFGESDDWVVGERSALACLLLPASGDELRRAVGLAERAVAAAQKSSRPGNPYVRFVKGLAEYRQGHPEQAIPWLEQSASSLPNRPGPRLVLAMAQFQSGSAREARKTLAAAVRVYPWNESPPASQADLPVTWVSHVLRREAEAMILPDLPAFLQGKYQPQDNDERLALLPICQFQRRYGAVARLFADAFAADPNLAQSLNTECLVRAQGPEAPADRIEVFDTPSRYVAARCAALAGCGLGSDVANVSEEVRTRWRMQAREWLRADLAEWAKMQESSPGTARDLAKKMLTHWLVEADLSGLREPAELDKLSADERKDCQALWHEIGVVLKLTPGD